LTTATIFRRHSGIRSKSVRRLQIGVFSHASDMHAHVISRELLKFDDVACEVFAVDRLHEFPSMVWSNASKVGVHNLPTMPRGQSADIADLDVIWWRRSPSGQAGTEAIANSQQVELIDNDCAAAVTGLTDVAFRGIWVSNPLNTRRADNKIVQLHIARSSGLQVPRTLVTQNPEAIRTFIKRIGRPIVVKALRGPANTGVATWFFEPQYLVHTESIQAAPAIYQEYVPGTRHLRVHCFGKKTVTALIESENLDWRGDLTVPFRPFSLPKHIEQRLLLMLGNLGLRMGIFDMKIGPRGEYVWLEVNPQGQFLFIEGLVPELQLARIFSVFLREQALAAKRLKVRYEKKKLRRPPCNTSPMRLTDEMYRKEIGTYFGE
jgi:glutathione synthase/RimK-type ligase-like ATP-grasp enzyme